MSYFLKKYSKFKVKYYTPTCILRLSRWVNICLNFFKFYQRDHRFDIKTKTTIEFLFEISWSCANWICERTARVYRRTESTTIATIFLSKFSVWQSLRLHSLALSSRLISLFKLNWNLLISSLQWRRLRKQSRCGFTDLSLFYSSSPYCLTLLRPTTFIGGKLWRFIQV
jgi:hypothetical protein